MSRRIGLVVGDTAGHFYPALAVARAYARHTSGVDVTFFGPRNGRAAAMAADHGCAYLAVSSSQIKRTGPMGVAAAAVRTLAGIAEARRLLSRGNIDLVLGFGGFASGAVLLAARSLGRRTVIHEANVIPGLANRWLSRVAQRVFLSEWTPRAAFPRARIVVTGWPVRDDVTTLHAETRLAPGANAIKLLVCTGSRGGKFFAAEVPLLAIRLAKLGLAVSVRHQSGDADAGALRHTYAEAGIDADVTPFVNDIAAAYRWADVAVSRAGAGAIAELALAGVPAVFVPLKDAADNHQLANARAAGDATGAIWTTEAEWNIDVMADRIRALVEPDAWRAASRASRRWAEPAAARNVVAACEALIVAARESLIDARVTRENRP